MRVATKKAANGREMTTMLRAMLALALAVGFTVFTNTARAEETNEGETTVEVEPPEESAPAPDAPVPEEGTANAEEDEAPAPPLEEVGVEDNNEGDDTGDLLEAANADAAEDVADESEATTLVQAYVRVKTATVLMNVAVDPRMAGLIFVNAPNANKFGVTLSGKQVTLTLVGKSVSWNGFTPVAMEGGLYKSPAIAIKRLTRTEETGALFWKGTEEVGNGVEVTFMFEKEEDAADAANAFIRGSESNGTLTWVFGTDNDNDHVPDRMDSCPGEQAITASGCPAPPETAYATVSAESPAEQYVQALPSTATNAVPYTYGFKVVPMDANNPDCKFVGCKVQTTKGLGSPSGAVPSMFGTWQPGPLPVEERTDGVYGKVSMYGGSVGRFDNGKYDGGTVLDFDGRHVYRVKFKTGSGQFVEAIEVRLVPDQQWTGEVRLEHVPPAAATTTDG